LTAVDSTHGQPGGGNGNEAGPVAVEEMASDETAETLPAFPMPLGIEKIRVDIRTGRLSRDPEHSLTVTVRGTNPRERPDIIPPGGDEPEETSSTDPPAQAEPPGQAGRAAQER